MSHRRCADRGQRRRRTPSTGTGRGERYTLGVPDWTPTGSTTSHRLGRKRRQRRTPADCVGEQSPQRRRRRVVHRSRRDDDDGGDEDDNTRRRTARPCTRAEVTDINSEPDESLRLTHTHACSSTEVRHHASTARAQEHRHAGRTHEEARSRRTDASNNSASTETQHP